jgi:hypothetical protein
MAGKEVAAILGLEAKPENDFVSFLERWLGLP